MVGQSRVQTLICHIISIALIFEFFHLVWLVIFNSVRRAVVRKCLYQLVVDEGRWLLEIYHGETFYSEG